MGVGGEERDGAADRRHGVVVELHRVFSLTVAEGAVARLANAGNHFTPWRRAAMRAVEVVREQAHASS
jgi:hypothetical protein